MFPQRSMIIYLAVCLIVPTLVVQGLTLPWLIRRLGLSEPLRMKDEEHEARRVLLRCISASRQETVKKLGSVGNV
jgi:NhaP-type Na+/H+ or K+/H+ antiporter